MNDLEKAYREGFLDATVSHGGFIVESNLAQFWNESDIKAETPSPAHMEPSKWTQVKPVEAGAYWDWGLEQGAVVRVFKDDGTGRLRDEDGDTLNAYSDETWWLRIEDVAPTIQEEGK